MLKVLTLNLWNIMGPLAERRVEARRWLELLDADVVCLQEVVHRGDGPSAHEAIWEGLGYSVHFTASAPFGDEGDFGNCILTRLAAGDVEHRVLPGLDREERRLVQHLGVELPDGRRADVYNTHLNWHFDEGYVRLAQVLALDSYVRETATEQKAGAQPPLICGDFNADPGSDEIRFLGGLHVAEGRSAAYLEGWRAAGGAGPGHTWDNRNPFAASVHEPDRRLDYIWCGVPEPVLGRGRFLACRLVCDRALTGSFASDHFGVYAEIVC